MKIGIPKEVKNHEYRVGATPAMVQVLKKAGHTIFVQKAAGESIGFSDQMFQTAGAELVASAEEVYEADLIVKVKEPQQAEFPLLKKGQVLFCYLHLAPDALLTAALLERQVIGIAYETVTDAQGRLPLLTPMSEIAGRIAIQAGAHFLQMTQGGKGILLGGVPGVSPGNVMIIGGGIVGTQAARMALGLGANVTILDTNPFRLRELDERYGPNLKTLYSNPWTVEELLVSADLVVGAVLIPGKLAPKVVTRQMIKKMRPGSVIVDVAIDQGGCFETSKATTHSEPVYSVDGITHYCVANMPGACARTATLALTQATFPYLLKLVNEGYLQALKEPYFQQGLNVFLGQVTNEAVAADLGYPYSSPSFI